MIDRHSLTWASVEKHAMERIDRLHRDMESPTADVARLQGEIKAWRDLLRLVEPPVVIGEIAT